MSKIDYILFDAANTLIHKPQFWIQIDSVLKANGFDIEMNRIKLNHKILSESIKFPDRTDKEFYTKFNSELILSLGIAPSNSLLTELFSACSCLEWEAFEDASILSSLKCKMGVLSNFRSELNTILAKTLHVNFDHIFISENEQFSKPDTRFFQKSLDTIAIKAENILYVGDSIKLDMIPAMELGFQVLLIDRDDHSPLFEKRIKSLTELTELTKKS